MTCAREREAVAWFREQFPARLRCVQAKLRHPDEAKALLADIDETTRRQWTNGETLPNVTHVHQLRRACGVDLKWLLSP